mmetsp:Transcript_1653/g.2058  ORF Transcript_1653/g.2058 Transcript_1653/m.2058 type:complete len:123 (+) Transcript_1653:258-626(+)
MNTKKAIIKKPNKNNAFDTFKIIIPKDDKYLELSMCTDSREYIDTFVKILENCTEVEDYLDNVKEGISSLLIDLMDFMKNQQTGKIRKDYSVGQLVPHRQNMISRVGILGSIFKFLSLFDQK